MFTYMLTTVILSALGESRLDLYISLYTIEYLALTTLHTPFNPRAQKIISAVGYILLTVFMAIVALRVLEILYGIRLI